MKKNKTQSLNLPSEQRETVFVCVRRKRNKKWNKGMSMCMCMCVCALACHFVLESYAVVGSAECCEIYNYCGVLCYDSTGASGDSTSQRQAWETHSVYVYVHEHACVHVCMCLCVQTERQHLAQNIPNPPSHTHTHAQSAWRRVRDCS